MSLDRLIPIEFTQNAFDDLDGTWFRWKDKNDNYHPRSWYKENQNFGVRPRDLQHVERFGGGYLPVYRMTKIGEIDYRKISMTFHRSQIKIKQLTLAEQDLL